MSIKTPAVTSLGPADNSPVPPASPDATAGSPPGARSDTTALVLKYVAWCIPVVLIAAVVAIIVVATLSSADVAERADAIKVPETWRLATSLESGNGLCIGACTTVTRTYEVKDTVADPKLTLDATLGALPWKGIPDGSWVADCDGAKFSVSQRVDNVGWLVVLDVSREILRPPANQPGSAPGCVNLHTKPNK